MNETKLFLEQCFEFINGGTWNENEYSLEGIHVVKVTNLVNSGVERKKDDSYLPWSKYEKYQKHKLFEGDVVIATVGSHPTQQGSVVGRTSRIPKDFDGSFLNQNAVCLRNKDTNKINSRYFFYLTKTILFKGYIEGRAKGSANQVRMALSDLKKFNYYFPHISYQRKIAAILSTYDDLIENNNKRIALLEKMAEEIYREWFVHFRFPGYQDIKFEKGIPKGWLKDKAKIFFTYIKWKSYKSDELTISKNSMPFITLKSFNRGGGYRAEGLKYFSGSFHKQQVVFTGDVVMAVTDMTQNREIIGRVALIPNIGNRGAVISLDVIKLIPTNISLNYLYCYMKYSGFGNFIKVFANGTNVLHLKPDVVTQQEIVVPTEKLQKKFDEIITPFHKQIEILNKESENLELTKNSLLPYLISGKLSVENLDITFPPSMQQEEGKLD